MATKTEKTKEQRIKTEKSRLKKIFKDLDENKKNLVTPLIEKAAFMIRTARTSTGQRKAQRQKRT